MKKKIVIVIFDDFTDIDLFLMWDVLGRNKVDWEVKIIGEKESHLSSNGLSVLTHGNLLEIKSADVVLFSSGKGSRAAIKNENFMGVISENIKQQLIGSICSGALILASLGILKGITATTHPRAKLELEALGVEVIDSPLVCHGKVATAGGCLSAVYLVGWVVEFLYGQEKRDDVLKEILPVGQGHIYGPLISSSIRQGMSGGIDNQQVPFFFNMTHK
jgi:putative intracellular protease/amidase